MKQSIHSIKGYFRGAVTASAHGTDKKAQFPLLARSSEQDWGNSIQAKSSEKDSGTRVWVTIILPDKPELAGKQLQCNVTLVATFPKVDPAGNTFHVEHATFQDSFPLR